LDNASPVPSCFPPHDQDNFFSTRMGAETSCAYCLCTPSASPFPGLTSVVRFLRLRPPVFPGWDRVNALPVQEIMCLFHTSWLRKSLRGPSFVPRSIVSRLNPPSTRSVPILPPKMDSGEGQFSPCDSEAHVWQFEGSRK